MLFPKSARSVGGGISFAKLLLNQVTLCSERYKLSAGCRGCGRIALLAGDTFALCDAHHLQLNFGQFLFEHLR
jgi:hypothetical protein